MIAFIDDLPLVEFENGHIFAFRSEWLRQHLLKAAARAGYANWWLADHVAQSVTNYLVHQYQANVLGASELRNSVVEVLATIGYEEIGRYFIPTRPPREISLLEITRETGLHELAFFAGIREAILHEIEDRASSLCLIHLPHAVKKLLHVKLFTEECACFRDEIAAFSRNVIAQSGQTNFALLLR